MVVVDPGKYLMHPIGLNFPVGEQLVEFGFRGAKEVSRNGEAIHNHANWKSSKISNGFACVWVNFAGLIEITYQTF